MNSRLNIDRYAEENGIVLKKIFAQDLKNFPEHEEYDMLFILGGSQHLWNKDADPWLIDEVEYVSDAIRLNKKAIGICLGSQILAESLGAKVYECAEKEFGWYPIYLRDEGMNASLMQGIENGFISMHWHSDHFNLPDRTVSLAYTEVSPNQAFVSVDYPVLAFQFHPEYQVDMFKEAIMSLEEYWDTSRYVSPVDEVLAISNEIPDTYPLFKKLMDNAFLYFSKFNSE